MVFSFTVAGRRAGGALAGRERTPPTFVADRPAEAATDTVLGSTATAAGLTALVFAEVPPLGAVFVAVE